MITFRAVRGAALSAVAAGILLAGMAGSAKAQAPIGGGGTQSYVFNDSPDTDASGHHIGWDLLSHNGFPERRAFTVTFSYKRGDPYTTNPDGSLASDGGLNNVWSDAGPIPGDKKAINTLGTLRTQYSSGICHYEYRMKVTGTDEMGSPITPVYISGGINSYALSL